MVRVVQLIIVTLCTIGWPTIGHAGGWWKNFCERHLIGNDPYQFEDYSVDQLVVAAARSIDSDLDTRVLTDEIYRRLDTDLSYEDREILVKILAVVMEKEN